MSRHMACQVLLHCLPLQDVTCVGYTDMPSRLPAQSSTLYSNNISKVTGKLLPPACLVQLFVALVQPVLGCSRAVFAWLY